MDIAIVGTGAMGKAVREAALRSPGIQRVRSIEPLRGETLWDMERPHVVIDFSHPDALRDICGYAAMQEGKTGVVFATTGFSQEDERMIEALGKKAPIIKSANFSFGVYALKKITELAASILGGLADIEIIETHHAEKADAPSGTALALAEVCDPEHRKELLYGRHGQGKRGNEIGLHSVRGGTVFGEHEILFAMENEVIQIRHRAFSREIFAEGAIRAALWLNGRKPGIYPVGEVFG